MRAVYAFLHLVMWAVSQATPLRRIDVVNDLCLFEYQPPITAAGESSGGYFANVHIGSALKSRSRKDTSFSKRAEAGTSNENSQHRSKTLQDVKLGSQQQWFARDSTVNKWDGGVWNVVTTGVVGAPPSHCSDVAPGPFTTVETTPTISEKPYITITSNGQFMLQIPPLKTDSKGSTFETSGTVSVPFSDVYVTSPDDSAAKINQKLSAGLHIVFTPGLYKY